MTNKQYINECTSAQRRALMRLSDRLLTGEPKKEIIERATAPTFLSPYIGIEINGVFYGIEADGHVHT